VVFLIMSYSTGFSFSGEVREPFPAVIQALQETQVPVTSVDAPSSWDIENGPPKDGIGSSFSPAVLVSLTAPKPLAKYFKGRHFIGGRCAPRCPVCFQGQCSANSPARFVSPAIAKKYDFELPEYEGVDQIVEVGFSGQKL
jgi:NAD(P)H-hydrate epimerase